MPSKIMHSNFNFKKAYGSVNSKRAHPASRAFVILSVPVVGICEKTSAQGWGKRETANTSFLFQYFQKNCTYLDSFIKTYFQNLCLKKHFRKKLLPAIVISSHMDEKQSMYHLKSLNEN